MGWLEGGRKMGQEELRPLRERKTTIASSGDKITARKGENRPNVKRNNMVANSKSNQAGLAGRKR